MPTSSIQQLESIMGSIRTHQEYSPCVSRDFFRYLREEAGRHSFLMEEQENTRVIYERLEKAWTLLSESGITMTSLSPLGHIIQPVYSSGPRGGKSTPNGFRPIGDEVEFGGGAWHGTASRLINPAIDELVTFLGTDLTPHPVVRAIEAHIRMLEIHPYGDGNGRAARLLQNFCLEQKGYPPAIITGPERDHYIGLIDEVHSERSHKGHNIRHPGKYEQLFRSFIFSKVLDSAEKLQTELKKSRKYEVSIFDTRLKETPFSIAKCLRSEGRRTDGGIKVSVGPRDKKKVSLIVTGDLSTEELDAFLKKCSPSGRRLIYEVKPSTCL